MGGSLIAKVSVISAALFSLFGCAGQEIAPTAPAPVANDRIEYRDLTVLNNNYSPSLSMESKVHCPLPNKADVAKEACPSTVTASFSNREIFNIKFANESSILDMQINSDIAELGKNLDSSSHYIVIGHSHGRSAKGNNYLASKRAERVYLWILNQGFPNKRVHRFASWSGHKEEFAPSIGVQVFKVDADFTITLSDLKGV